MRTGLGHSGGGRAGRLAAALVLLAFAIRLVAALGAGGVGLPFDALDYDRHARSIATGHGYPEAIHEKGGESALRPPAFPAALAAVYAVAGDPDPPPGWRAYFAPGYEPGDAGVVAGRVLQALIGTAIVALTGLVAFQLWGRGPGLVALGLTAVYPPLIVLGTTLYADPLFAALVLAATAAALRARGDPRLRWAVLAGGMAGLAWLTRSNGWVVLLPLALLVWRGRPRFALRSLAAPATVVLASLVLIAPWTVRNAAVMHAFIPVSDNGGYTLAGTYNETARTSNEPRALWRPAQGDPAMERRIATSGSELDESRVLGRAARRLALDHPAYVVEVAGCNTLRLMLLAWTACGDSTDVAAGYAAEFGVPRWLAWVTVASFWVVALLALWGAFSAAARRAPLAFWLVPLVLLTTVLVLSANRFRAPIEPFLLMLAALSPPAGRLCPAAGGRRKRRLSAMAGRSIT